MYSCPMCKAEVSVETRFCQKCGYNKAHEKQSTPPKSSPGLIRPMGGATSRPSALEAQSIADAPTMPQATPAHLLALTPITPPGLSSIDPPLPKVDSARPQQFLRPGFLPAKTKSPDTLHASEQQTQQVPAALPEQQGRTSPLEDLPTMQFQIEVVKGRPPLVSAHDDFDRFEDNFESYVATSKAAEHWRTSWRKRQQSETGPATSVARGLPVVPEPPPGMQNSLAPHQKQNANPGFWITFILMVCLAAGLAAFIASTYLPDASNAVRITAPADTHQPALRIAGLQAATFSQGQMLHLHGENFAAGTPIIFLLDGTTTIHAASGLAVSVLTTSQGIFDVALPTATWSLGEHLVTAQDNTNGQSAYLNIQLTAKD